MGWLAVPIAQILSSPGHGYGELVWVLFHEPFGTGFLSRASFRFALHVVMAATGFPNGLVQALGIACVLLSSLLF
jgi:hypothetical protein